MLANKCVINVRAVCTLSFLARQCASGKRAIPGGLGGLSCSAATTINHDSEEVDCSALPRAWQVQSWH